MSSMHLLCAGFVNWMMILHGNWWQLPMAIGTPCIWCTIAHLVAVLRWRQGVGMLNVTCQVIWLKQNWQSMLLLMMMMVMMCWFYSAVSRICEPDQTENVYRTELVVTSWRNEWDCIRNRKLSLAMKWLIYVYKCEKLQVKLYNFIIYPMNDSKWLFRKLYVHTWLAACISAIGHKPSFRCILLQKEKSRHLSWHPKTCERQ